MVWVEKVTLGAYAVFGPWGFILAAQGDWWGALEVVWWGVCVIVGCLVVDDTLAPEE